MNTARKPSLSGIYLVVLHAARGQAIFLSDLDRRQFLNCFAYCKKNGEFSLHAYCLTDRCIYFLAEEHTEPPAVFVRRIASTYYHYLLKTQGKGGPRFEGGFRTYPVESPRVYLDLICSIYNIPVDQGLCVDAAQYPWSSLCAEAEENWLVDAAMGNNLLTQEELRRLMESKAHRRRGDDDPRQ